MANYNGVKYSNGIDNEIKECSLSNNDIEPSSSTKSKGKNYNQFKEISIIIHSPSKDSQNSYCDEYSERADNNLDTTPLRLKDTESKDGKSKRCESTCSDSNNYLPTNFNFSLHKIRLSDKKSGKDLDSICTGNSVLHRSDRSESHLGWCKNPKVRENWRVFFTAFGLLLIGIGLLAMGIVITLIPEIGFQSYVFFIVGAICFIPGGKE